MNDGKCSGCLHQPEAPNNSKCRYCLSSALINHAPGFSPKPTFEPETCGNCGHHGDHDDYDRGTCHNSHLSTRYHDYQRPKSNPDCSWAPIKKCATCGGHGEIMESEDELAESIPCPTCSPKPEEKWPESDRTKKLRLENEQIDRNIEEKVKKIEAIINPTVLLKKISSLEKENRRLRKGIDMALLAETYEEQPIILKQALEKANGK